MKSVTAVAARRPIVSRTVAKSLTDNRSPTLDIHTGRYPVPPATQYAAVPMRKSGVRIRIVICRMVEALGCKATIDRGAIVWIGHKLSHDAVLDSHHDGSLQYVLGTFDERTNLAFATRHLHRASSIRIWNGNSQGRPQKFTRKIGLHQLVTVLAVFTVKDDDPNSRINPCRWRWSHQACHFLRIESSWDPLRDFWHVIRRRLGGETGPRIRWCYWRRDRFHWW